MDMIAKSLKSGLIALGLLVLFSSPAFAQTPINCGDIVNGQLEEEEIDEYTFFASDSDVITIVAGATSGTSQPFLELYGPDDALLASGAVILSQVNLPATGTYLLRLSADSVITYQLGWQKVNNPCNAQAINWEENISIAVNGVSESKVFTFQGNNADVLTISPDILSGNFALVLQLYDSQGNLLQIGDEIKTILPATGTFNLFIYTYAFQEAGSYQFSLKESPQVSLLMPSGGDLIEAGSTYRISWNSIASQDNGGVVSQELRLSTDSGLTYPIVIASGLNGAIQFYDWPVPDALFTIHGKIKVTATDGMSKTGIDQSDADLVILKTTLPAESKDFIHEYDKLNHLARTTSQDILDTTYTYDALGNRLMSLDLTNQASAWTLILPVPWYLEEKTYYSGAASSKMLLDYIRLDTSLTQDQVHNQITGGTQDMNPQQLRDTLNYFKPAPYNFTIISKADITEALRDIAHWMDYEVPGVTNPHSPVIIPTFAGYDNWMVVRGAAASQDPNANENLWNTASFTVYGFWLNDPAVQGIGENSYKTAVELLNTYYRPLSTQDTYNTKYLAVAEPPKVLSQAKVKIADIYVGQANRELSGLVKANDEVDLKLESQAVSLSGAETKSLSRAQETVKQRLVRFNWKEIIDPTLFKDEGFSAAFQKTVARQPLRVSLLGSKDEYYYLVPFDISNRRQLTSVVLIVDGPKLYFKEASWVKKPVRYPQINKQQAIQLANNYLRRIIRGRQLWYPNMKARAELVWKPGELSTSPYRPFWKVTIGNRACFVTDRGKVVLDK